MDYNAFRPAYGLARLNSIAQLTSDPDLRAKLVSLYGNINSIDAWVGGIAENHVAGSSVGAMVMASLVDQFTRLRDGDRLFYIGDVDLQTAMFRAAIDLDSVTLADIIRLNTGITNLQSNVFLATTAGLAGDFNFDGSVDSADYTVWRDALGDECFAVSRRRCDRRRARDAGRLQHVEEQLRDDVGRGRSRFGFASSTGTGELFADSNRRDQLDLVNSSQMQSRHDARMNGQAGNFN